MQPVVGNVKLLLFAVAFAFAFLALGLTAFAQVDCSMPDADVFFEECRSPIDCSVPNSAELFPGVCGGSDTGTGGDGTGDDDTIDCSIPDADVFFEECRTVIDCTVPGAAELFPECRNNPPVITEFVFPKSPSASQGRTIIAVRMKATDADGNLASLELRADSANAKIIDDDSIFDGDGFASSSRCTSDRKLCNLPCSGGSCSANFLVELPGWSDGGIGQTFTLTATAFDALNAMATKTDSGKIDAPVSAQPAPTVEACTSAAWSCTAFSPNVCPSSAQRTRTCTLTDTTCSNPNAVKPSEAESCTPEAVADASPSITDFTTPSNVDASSSFTVWVTATDDKGVDKIDILNSDGSIAAASQSCANVLSCTKSFIVQAPSAFGFVFKIIARAFDTGAEAVTKDSNNIITNPAAAPTPTPTPEPKPEPVPVPTPEKALEAVKVSIPPEALFVSTIVPDSSCVAPGAETYMFVGLKNRGESSLKDVKITVFVPELDLYAASGPFRIRKEGSASRFIPISVPEDAAKGTYFARIQVTAEKDSVIRHRIFDVSPSC